MSNLHSSGNAGQLRRLWNEARGRRLVIGAAVLLTVAALALSGYIVVLLSDGDRPRDPAGLVSSQQPPTFPPAASADGNSTISPALPPRSVLDPNRVTVPAGDGVVVSWALADIPTGLIIDASVNAGVGFTTESMVKAWIAADYLARHTTISQHKRDQIQAMIWDSDNDAAQDLYASGGYDLVIGRLVANCYLTGTSIHHDWWSLTTMNAVDAARMGACIASSQAAGPAWTPFLLETMRGVRGRVGEQDGGKSGGRWGIVDALPGHDVAMKNGWTIHDDGLWHVNCLGIVDGVRSLAVMMVYPADEPLEYGARICADVTRQLAAAPA